nr:reverse transcriptase domain-containing protein [Tanacetum cinerariifolium]
MANATPLVTTVMKPTNDPGEANTAPRVNIHELCEEYYEDILPIIMEKARHERLKDVHTRLDFGEGPKERIREDSYYSNTRDGATESGRVKVQDRLKYGNRHVLDRLGHRRQSAFDRLSETYSPSTTKSRPQKTNFRDSPRGRSRTRSLTASKDGRHKDRECLRSTRESYGDSFPYSYRDGSHHHPMKRKRDKSPQFSAAPTQHPRRILTGAQKKRSQAPKRAKAIQEEVQKLVEAGIMREVYYHDWLSNSVMVKKHDGRWRMCVDFTDLNKACPQDCYPLSEIDWNVESLCGYPFKCFLDAYKATIKYSWQKRMKRRQFSTQDRGCTATLRCLLASRMLVPHGSSCVDGSGAGLILTNPEGVEFTYALRFQFAASNNEAEYEALVVGLPIATQMGVKNVQVNVDSKLVANQVLGTYVAKEDNMIKYLEIVKGLIRGFTTFSISQVPRSKNKKADALSKIASTSFAHLSKQVLVEVLENKSIRGKEVTAGIDIACPFPEGPGKVKFLIVAIDYFTKWIKAKAVATITDGQVKKFVWDDIVCRFGIPGEIISDNGKQFGDNPFKDWCDKLNITHRFASVKHPQSNGLVKRANQSLREGIKSRLGEGNKNWVEELPHVLWAHRTMIKSSHGDTPFSLTYGTEAVIPTEIGMPTYRTAAVNVVNNDEELQERWERAAVCEAKSKSKMMKYYNARVRGVAFRPGDFVYRSNDASHAVAGGKLGPK